MGSGRTELARAIIGEDKILSGKVWKDGREIKISSPKNAIKSGICYLPEDRKAHGLFLEMGVRFNITISKLERIISGCFVKKILKLV